MADPLQQAETIRRALMYINGKDAESRHDDAEAALDSLLALVASLTTANEAMTTTPTGEGAEELRKARMGEGLTATETLVALRAAMEVADRARERGQEHHAALILWTGQNPRKPQRDDAFDDLLDELADTALTAIYATQHFTKDADSTLSRLWARAALHRERLARAVSVVPEGDKPQ